jgi:hypothetical protein
MPLTPHLFLPKVGFSKDNTAVSPAPTLYVTDPFSFPSNPVVTHLTSVPDCVGLETQNPLSRWLPTRVNSHGWGHKCLWQLP